MRDRTLLVARAVSISCLASPTLAWTDFKTISRIKQERLIDSYTLELSTSDLRSRQTILIHSLLAYMSFARQAQNSHAEIGRNQSIV